MKETCQLLSGDNRSRNVGGSYCQRRKQESSLLSISDLCRRIGCLLAAAGQSFLLLTSMDMKRAAYVDIAGTCTLLIFRLLCRRENALQRGGQVAGEAPSVDPAAAEKAEASVLSSVPAFLQHMGSKASQVSDAREKA